MNRVPNAAQQDVVMQGLLERVAVGRMKLDSLKTHDPCALAGAAAALEHTATDGNSRIRAICAARAQAGSRPRQAP